jgi:RND family efflux transporter MFP subunit
MSEKLIASLIESPRHVAVAAVFAAVVLGACSRAEPQMSPPPPPPVSVAAAMEREVAEWDEFSGRLEAVERVDIRPRVNGYLQAIHFRQGAEVKKGELLFTIDPRPYQAELARAEAALAGARTRAGLARTELARAERLLADNAIAKREYDERVATQHDTEASIRAAEAAVQTARLNLEFTQVRSPIAGRVSKAEVTVGNLVVGDGPTPTQLTSVVSQDPIYVSFEGDEQAYLKYVALARSGERPSSRRVPNPVYMGLGNEEGFPHKGYMEFVDNQLDPRTGTIRARAVFENKDGLFTPGLFARLKLIGSGTYRAVLIDDKAVGTDQSKKFVLVLGPENKVTYRTVKLGPLVDGMRVVKDGLKEGELIVVNGLQRVKPGSAVTPQAVPMGSSEQADSRLPLPEESVKARPNGNGGGAAVKKSVRTENVGRVSVA